MNQHKLFLGLVIVMLLMGCGTEITPMSTVAIPEITATALPSLTPSPTQRPTLTATSTPAYPPETRLKSQCLEILPELPSDFVSSGIVVLGRRVGENRSNFETILLDMATGQTTSIIMQDQFLGFHVVSSDRKLIAYYSSNDDADGKTVSEELVISAVDGHTFIIIKTIPWEKKWRSLLGWKGNESLIFDFDEPVFSASGEQKSLISYLVLNPFSGERQILRTDFPNFVLTALPAISWDGWEGVSFDPTLNLAVYPSFFGEKKEMYTYTLWDVSKRDRVVSLENIFAAYSDFHDTFPMPRWSPDGSQFVFVGLQVANPGVFELYRVTKDGQTEQLTHLNSVRHIESSGLSWSPDGRYIAMLLSLRGDPEFGDATPPYLAVLDTKTMEVTDYCVQVRSKGGEPPPPIWSEDGKRFLLETWTWDDHRRVILIDIEKGIAAQIAENMWLSGWMASP